MIAMKRIRCPIHNHITLNDRMLAVIDHPSFQRLRGIKQLGMAYLVYPGARHTRFEHSLGVLHLASSVSSILGFTQEQTSALQYAGLLHDIGHGPCSHVMESFHGGPHEQRSADIIMRSDIGDLLRGAGVEPRFVADTILGRTELSPLISSEIDIDRMDYLVRDAHYTGVSTALDSGRLSAVMELRDGLLVYRESGLGAVEALLLARFMMYPYVYYHHTARAAERMLARAIELGLEDGGISPEDLWRMDDIALVSWLRTGVGRSGELMAAIDTRRLHKRGWERSVTSIIEGIGNGDDGAMAESVSVEELRTHLTPCSIRAMEREIAENLDLAPAQVIMDCPLPPALRTGQIRILMRDGSIRPARSLSRIIDIMEQAQLDHWRFRMYVPAGSRERALRLYHDDLIPCFEHA